MASAPASTAAAASQPSASLVSNLRTELMRHAPFAQMPAPQVDHFIAACQQAYYAPGETVLAPADAAPAHLIYLRQGHVTGRVGGPDAPSGFEYDAGDLFPVGAVLASRPVTATYQAQQDVFCLLMPVAEVTRLSAQSPVFADFLARRVMTQLALSRQAMQATYAAQALAEQSLETPLGELARKSLAAVPAHTPLAQALTLMHDRHVGSVLVTDAAGQAQGILTRHDVLGRVTLAQLPLTTPIADVMSAPVRTLSRQHTAQDAALLMSRHNIRHVPVTQDGLVVGLVSQNDLFAMQRLSLKHVSGAIRAAQTVDDLARAAQDIRRFARNLVGQGVAARQLTQLISHLNDVLTEQLVNLLARQRGLDMQQACWLAFGSEGRSEQTIATDQDNGLVFASSATGEALEHERALWLQFALAVNQALDQCGYPLCTGNVMASNPQCCLSQAEWLQRFEEWMQRGAPEDLLKASIYFDLRPLVGQASLAESLRALVVAKAASVPRFIKQMADNSLRNRVPLNWLGALETQAVDGREMLDLKHHGTAIFVDIARLYALAHGVAATGTRERFEALGPLLNAQPQESQAWIASFEYLQMQRLQVQLAPTGVARQQPNLIELATLNDIDRRILKESLRVARSLQQKLELDYQR